MIVLNYATKCKTNDYHWALIENDSQNLEK